MLPFCLVLITAAYCSKVLKLLLDEGESDGEREKNVVHQSHLSFPVLILWKPRSPCEAGLALSGLVSSDVGHWEPPGSPGCSLRLPLAGVLLAAEGPRSTACFGILPGNFPARWFPFSKSPLAVHFSLFKYEVTGNSCWDQQQFSLIELHKSKAGSVNLIYFLTVK